MAEWHSRYFEDYIDYWERSSADDDHPARFIAIRRYDNKPRQFSIVKYKSFRQEEVVTLAGPFSTLRTAKVTWLLLFPILEYSED